MHSRWLILIHFTAIWFTLSSTAFGQVVIRSLDHPLPEQFRVRAEAMVRALRPKDAAEALVNLRTSQGSEHHSEWVILRVEANCRFDRCMTVIARNNDSGMIPELIVNAGKAIYVGDASSSLWGLSAWSPIGFQGAGGATLNVTRRGEYWVVEACADCLTWPASTLRQPPEVPPPPSRTAPEPMSFEEFKRTFGL